MESKKCPRCGASDFVVTLPAAFSWDGKKAALGPEDLFRREFYLHEGAKALCMQCDQIWSVADLKEGE